MPGNASRGDGTERTAPLWAIRAIGAFLFFGAAMACFAGATLIWRGTVLDRVWVLNADAYRQMEPYGKLIGVPFLGLSAALAVAGIGWFRRRVWGWRLAVAIIATQVLGDLTQVLTGHYLKGLVGATIAGALLVYLFRANVRAVFVGAALPAKTALTRGE